MATHIRGSMATAGQAITAKNHNISISPDIKRMIGKALIRQTRVRETDAGKTQKKINDVAIASGIPLETIKHIAEKSGYANLHIAQQTANKLYTSGIIQKEIRVIHELDPQKLDAIMQSINKNRFDIVNIMDDRTFEKLMRDVDKYAENYNVYRISTMSKKKLIELRSGYKPGDDMHEFIDNVIKLKDHQGKLRNLRIAQNSHHHTIKRIVRTNTKDLDAVNAGFTIYDTADSIQRTVKTVKRISERLNHAKAANASAAARQAASATQASNVAANSTAAAKAAGAATKAAGATGAAGTAGAGATTTATASTVGATSAGATATGATTAGTVTAGAGGVTLGIVAAIVVGVVLLFFMFTMLIALSSANSIPGFSSSADGNAVESVFDSQAGEIYNNLREKDALFVDTINNYRNNNSPKDVTGRTVYGYWDHSSGSRHVISKWDNVKTSWVNGSGDLLSSTSNAKGILSTATVFVEMDSFNLRETYEKYCYQLWQDSHKYTTTASSVYACNHGCSEQTYQCSDEDFYNHKNSMVIIGSAPVRQTRYGCETCSLSFCSGCKIIYCDGYHKDEKCTGHSICPGHLKDKYNLKCLSFYYKEKTYSFGCSGCIEYIDPETQTTSIEGCSNDGLHTVYVDIPTCIGHCYGHQITVCLGHVDLSMEVTVNHIDDETNNLFDVDSTGKRTGEDLSIVSSSDEKYDWDGWDSEKKEHAIMLAQDDWYELYGIGVSDYQNFFYTPVSEEVLAYSSTISRFAEMHGISEYTDLVKAVMMQESGGRGLDPMQSSECGYNTLYPNEPNGITSPEYSINVGIQYLADCLRKAKVNGPSDMERIKLALQAYNYGPNYINWALDNYGGYTLENAAAYSDMMATQMNWSGYGDKQYVPHVLRYYVLCQGNESIVNVALSQVGNVGGAPYWLWYGYNERVAWCACFVSWCADQCGYIESGTIPKFAYCPTGADWFKQNGMWQNNNYEPVAGDIIFFDWEGDGVTDHVGIVSKTTNGTVYTVEGNSSDQCKQKQYAVGSSCIYGYGIPAYPTE